MLRIGLALAALAAMGIWIYGRRRWSAAPLAIIAFLGLAATSLLALGLLTERHHGGYRPARIENGRLLPGEIE